MVAYELMDTIIRGRNKSYPPVSSAIKKVPVRGACITPAITPAIPNREKFSCGKKRGRPMELYEKENKNPTKHPKNRVGAKIPPVPPAPLVALDANTLVSTISITKTMIPQLLLKK